MDKHSQIIESIRKLISLGVSDEEIKQNLTEVGVSSDDADSLIEEAHEGLSSGKSADDSSKIKPLREDDSFKGSSNSFDENKEIKKEDLEKNKFSEEFEELDFEEQIARQIPTIKNEEVDSDEEAIAIAELSEEKQEPEDIVNKIISEVSKSSSKAPEKIASAPSTDSEKKPEFKKDSSVEKNQSSSWQLSQQNPIASNKEAPLEKNQVQQNKLEIKNESIVKDFSLEQEKAPKKRFSFDEPLKDSYSFGSSSDVDELWKQGIIVAVNAKLSEMKKIRDDIVRVVEENVDSAVRKEFRQLKVLLESQRDLIIASNKEALEQKQKEITFIIDAKIAELKKYNNDLAVNLSVLESMKEENERALNAMNAAFEDAKRIKASIITEMNSEMIKIKSQFEALQKDSEKRLREMDERVNKTLELEKKLAEGLIENAEQKIEQMALKKAEDLIDELEIELNRIRSIQKNLSLETLEQKIKTLDEFKAQFLDSMKKNLAEMNQAIQLLNQQNEFAKEQLKQRMLIFDAKIEELTKFEKQFTEYMAQELMKQNSQK